MLLPWLSWCLFFLFSLLLLFLSVLCIQPLNEWSDAVDLKTQPPTHTSLLSPCVSGHLYLDICYIPQAEHVNWTHYLPFLLLPTSHSPSPIFFCVTTPILDRKTHHLTQHLHAVSYQVLSPNISSFCPINCSTAAFFVQATSIFHLDTCSIFSAPLQVATLHPWCSPCYHQNYPSKTPTPLLSSFQEPPMQPLQPLSHWFILHH